MAIAAIQMAISPIQMAISAIRLATAAIQVGIVAIWMPDVPFRRQLSRSASGVSPVAVSRCAIAFALLP